MTPSLVIDNLKRMIMSIIDNGKIAKVCFIQRDSYSIAFAFAIDLFY